MKFLGNFGGTMAGTVHLTGDTPWEIHPGGDHAIVVGEVVEAGVQRDVDPLTLKETGWNYGG